MSKQEILKSQTCVLRVNIHCDGCKQKVKKKLLKVEGVYAVKIDVENGKVTVTGNADPATLIKKLEKSGKHAELWSQKGGHSFNMMNNQFMNMQLGDFKGGKDLKLQNKGGGKEQKGGGGGHMMPNLMKGAPPKTQKTVKFNLPEEDEFDDFDEFDEDESDDESDDEIESGHHHHPPSKSKMMPIMGGGGGKGGGGGFSGMMNMLKGGAGGHAKKGGGVEIPAQFKGMSGGNLNDSKNINAGKNGKGGGQIHGGGKNNGKNGGVFQGDGRDNNGKGGGQKNGDNWDQKGGPNYSMGPGGRGMGQMGQMGRMGNYPMGPMGNMAAVQGLPAPGAMKSGYFPGMGQGGVNPYNPIQQQQQQQQQHQQYMAQMMMNQYQQRPNGYDMYGGAHPMMYAPQHPAMGYGPPMHPPVNDNFTHMFSDENTGSCSVM